MGNSSSTDVGGNSSQLQEKFGCGYREQHDIVVRAYYPSSGLRKPHVHHLINPEGRQLERC